tara:strand:- start:7124 stop:7663 length:540 start_codon:yes stop_codon:yes gene_type:complete
MTLSRIAKQPVTIPAGVEVKMTHRLMDVKGKLGHLSQEMHELVVVNIADNEISFTVVDDTKEAKALSGTMRALTQNMVTGVSDGFQKMLKMVGVGYRATVQGKTLNISAGFSHPVTFDFPEGVAIETPSNTEILLKGADKQKVNQAAAKIRAIRPPEPYKGKGIRYADEVVILKEGKKK